MAGKTITRRSTPEQQQRYQDWFDNAYRPHQLVTELGPVPTSIRRSQGLPDAADLPAERLQATSSQPTDIHLRITRLAGTALKLRRFSPFG
jgi:hypothetical protein